jgi:acetyl-CoA acetyltransferase
LLADAFVRALSSAGLNRDDVDGLALSSFTFAPDHVIDLAWRLGVRVNWLMEETNGGAGGLNMLQHASRAIEAGDASVIVVLAGDCFVGDAFASLVANFNRATQEHLAPIPHGGPNALFALLTARHMAAHSLELTDYGHVPLVQRRWAAKNPLAVYRAPLTIEEYLTAPVVADPLRRYDCVPVVSGADAVVVTSRDVAGKRAVVEIASLQARYNHDQQAGDGLTTGLAEIRDRLWHEAGAGPADMDVVCIYDDYPVMVLVQLSDLGFIPNGDVREFIHTTLGGSQDWPLNTSGGQLSAGQAGAAGGLHGLVEAITQLRGEAGARQVPDAQWALVTGYGMILYRYGACTNATILRRAG